MRRSGSNSLDVDIEQLYTRLEIDEGDDRLWSIELGGMRREWRRFGERENE